MPPSSSARRTSRTSYVCCQSPTASASCPVTDYLHKPPWSRPKRSVVERPAGLPLTFADPACAQLSWLRATANRPQAGLPSTGLPRSLAHTPEVGTPQLGPVRALASLWCFPVLCVRGIAPEVMAQGSTITGCLRPAWNLRRHLVCGLQSRHGDEVPKLRLPLLRMGTLGHRPQPVRSQMQELWTSQVGLHCVAAISQRSPKIHHLAAHL